MFDYMNPKAVSKKLSLKRVKTNFSAWINYQKLKNKSSQEIIGILLMQSPAERVKLLLQKEIRDKIDFVNNFLVISHLSFDEKESIMANLSHDEILKGLCSNMANTLFNYGNSKALSSKLTLEDIVGILGDVNLFNKMCLNSNLHLIINNLSDNDKILIMNNPNILNSLDSISLGNLLSELNLKFEDIVDLMNNQLFISKLNLSEMLSKLSFQELEKALKNSEITANLGKDGLVSLFSSLSPDNLVGVVNNLDIVSMLGADGLSKLSSNISSYTIMKAIKNWSINDNGLDFFVTLLSKKSLQLTELLLKMPLSFKVEALHNNTLVSKLSSSDLQEIISKLQPNQILVLTYNRSILDKVGLTNMLSLLPMNDLNIFEKVIKIFAGKENYDYVIKNKEYIKNVITRAGSFSIILEMNFDLFRDDIISSLSSQIFEKLCTYRDVSKIVVDLFNSSNDLGKYFSAMFDSIQGKHFTANMNFDLLTLRLISSLRNIDSKVLKFALNIDVNSLSEDDFTKLASIALSDKRNINVSLESKEDLKTYDERLNKKCDEVFKDKVEGNNIDAAKNAYFNKYYGMSFENVLEMISKYGYSLDNLDLSDESIRKNYDYLMGIKNILDTNDMNVLKEVYDNSVFWSFEESLSFEQAIPQMYAKNISDSLYKLDGRKPKETIKYELDGKVFDIPVYEPEMKDDRYDFKMLVHSTDAYGSMELKNDSYYESWNNSGRVRNHGICCGLISNSYMGFPPNNGNGVILGFDSFSEKSLSASAPYDLGTSNDDYQIYAAAPNRYMTADDMINSSRGEYNEQTIERRELRGDGDKLDSKLQPSYVIISDDMIENVKDNAYKCAAQMNIPVVYLDKKKIGEKESEYINKRIKELKTVSNENERMAILKDILTVHENNRAGERLLKNEEREELFPTSKVEGVFASEVKRAVLQFQSGDMIDFSKASMEIMNILDSERAKNSLDFNVDEYEDSLMKLIPECGGDKNKFREMASDFAKRQAEEILKGQEDVNVQEKGRQL